MSISFKEEKKLASPIRYSGNYKEKNLQKLLNDYKLEQIIDSESSDFENIISIQSWVHGRWEHAKNSPARKKDALYILEQAEKGKRFSCAEYSIVEKACLQALGFMVREIHLKPSDPELLKRNASHLLNEVYLKDLKKWFFIDPCFDIIIKKDGIPLHAVELLDAMIKGDELEVINPTGEITCSEYLEKIGPFLCYFSTSMNQKASGTLERIYKTEEELTYVPLCELAPGNSPRILEKRNRVITRAIEDLYPEL
ncbi:transglutaminase domain-containing protein [Christiangramia sabulilitoris]|uniref:Transglutaminase-like domain-containing protein n=1 Tax=Christiangramia sabulilitoris TaxID=2583991 RepID=A0A550I0L4_9FLAO|nr:transglutaminase domain-containing protein [Christiangramia sabulilitoris]TRO64527.1 hypothetical protein FGM01_13650 [Christiangramia sabulilitoris]